MPGSTPTASAFYDALVEHKLIIPVGVPGAFGRGVVFEDVLRRVDSLISRIARDDGAERMLFPPILDRRVMETSKFLDSFPQLAGTVFSFVGNDQQHEDLTGRVREGKPWADLQTMTDVVLSPAACYPVYPSFTGTVSMDGRLVDMQNWVFRHEPSPEPTRMQAFRVREFVRVGPPAVVIRWRDMWLERGISLLRSLGLRAQPIAASDPFFGRGGRMLAASQREQELKFEIVAPIISEKEPTALCSFNYHQEHFGKAFSICTEDGAVAQTACLGFGMERVVMALFKTHGFVPDEWPSRVIEVLS
jgi:seryl-tRNA synthetase